VRNLGTSAFFSTRPVLSAVVAVVFFALGAAFLNGWHPRAGVGEIARGEAVLMAGVCVVIGGFFLRFARLSRRSGTRNRDIPENPGNGDTPNIEK
jgi:hypothetical protein